MRREEGHELDGITLEWRGRLPYEVAHAEQRDRREAIISGRAPETVWLLEHEPVVTTGRRAVEGLDPRRLGLPVVATERGGLATYHGPGQLVGYLLLDLGKRGGAIRRMVCDIEGGLLEWLKERSVAAHRRDGYTGVWVGQNKIAAIGLHFRRGVSMHGFALNLTVDLDRFTGFVPCGVEDGGVTTLFRELGASPEPEEVAFEVGHAVLRSVLRSLLTR